MGNIFLQKYFFVTKSFGDLRMNFISPACIIFLCFVLLCTIFISFAKGMQEFFSHLPSHPLKNKMARP